MGAVGVAHRRLGDYSVHPCHQSDVRPLWGAGSRRSASAGGVSCRDYSRRNISRLVRTAEAKKCACVSVTQARVSARWQRALFQSKTPPNTACTGQVGFVAIFEHFSGFEFFLLPNLV